MINSEDEYDQDTQSIDENEDEEEQIDEQLIKAFGSTVNSDFQDEVQKATNKQGLSQKEGRKISKVPNIPPPRSKSRRC